MQDFNHVVIPEIWLNISSDQNLQDIDMVAYVFPAEWCYTVRPTIA